MSANVFCRFSRLGRAIGVWVVPMMAAGEGVQMKRLEDRVRVEVNGGLFTEYVFRGAPHVYFFPVIGPGGARMTRDWPMKDTAGEEHDHPHHRSLWFSHGSVNGVDFWSEGPKAGKILHERFLEIRSGAKEGSIRSANQWVAPDQRVVCRDERLFRVYVRPDNERLFDFEVTIHAPADHEVVLGDTKEGTMAVRIAESMRLSRPAKGAAGARAGEGRIVQSTGVRDRQCWGQRATWCDYHGPVEGKLLGIAILDHPSNPAHPTRWHVRDYGLFAANPFGIHDFSGKKEPAGAGALTIPAGKSVAFRYRFYLHEGDERQAKVAERYAEYVRCNGPVGGGAAEP